MSSSPLHPGISVPDEYRDVISLLKGGCPVVFLTGGAGTGKSTLIHYLRANLDMRLAVVAPTGVAALTVEGATIHSFFHLPPKIHEDEDIKIFYRDRQLLRFLQVLIIDEISMVRCDLMDSIDKSLRKNRSSSAPFGGVQLLLVGDLFQLPPVVKRQDWDVLSLKGYKSPHFFSAFSLQRLPITMVQLTKVHRQHDAAFVRLLEKVRNGEDLASVTAEINRRCWRQGGFRSDITLTCRNDAADQLNLRELGRLPGEEYSFRGRIEGQFLRQDDDNLPSPLDLKIKVGAHVMFTRNSQHWVNGTIGIVREVDGAIKVELVSESAGRVYEVYPATWENYRYVYDKVNNRIVAEKIGQYTQYPLMLAWAVTIHKSQGKTLSRVLIDFGDGAFASGQAYVALSRCRSLSDICLAKPMREEDVKCDPLVKRFYLDHARKEPSGNIPAKKAKAVKRVKRPNKVAPQEDVVALFEKGVKYHFGRGVEQDYAEAAKWYRKAAEQGHAGAQNNLGLMYDTGSGVEQVYAEAAKWYRLAAEQGAGVAQYNLGVMYAKGSGVEQDYAEAAKWYRKAAEQGLARAQYNLGAMYSNGQGVLQNNAQAAMWYRKAAEQGYTVAQYVLGVMYEEGCGVTQNFDKAAEWYRKAAEQNYVAAQYKLGQMYEKGCGVPQNYARAAEWYYKAAEQGYVCAQNSLGVMYYDGDGVTQNDAEAVAWFCKAAEQGHADAQFMLGLMYDEGRGIAQDYAKAIEWYRKAAEQGHVGARSALLEEKPDPLDKLRSDCQAKLGNADEKHLKEIAKVLGIPD